MPPRLTPPPRGSFYPPSDAATYRDLLMFEERLKTNAASLQRRKSRYQLFLLQLVILIAFLLSEVFLQTSFLSLPYLWFVHGALPDIDPPPLHPYFASGLLFVSVTTLILFFASGMYSEKIAYANRYVPHANRALRSLNMYLNVRKPPLSSRLPFKFLSFLFPRPEAQPLTSRPPSPSRTSLTSSSTSIPITPIPPATHPRGELIFSARVHPAFRESYERYRTAFERKREEREREEMAKTWWGWLWLKISMRGMPPQLPPTPGGLATGSSPRSGRGRGSTPGRTPSPSPRSSPVPVRNENPEPERGSSPVM